MAAGSRSGRQVDRNSRIRIRVVGSVGAGIAAQHIAAGAADEAVVSIAATQRVVADTAIEHIVVVTANEQVRSFIAVKRIIAGAATKFVVTNAATGDIEDMAKPEDLQAIAVPDDAKALLAGAGPAASSGPVDFATALEGLKSDSFADKGKAIEALTALGDVRAIPVFRALADGRLFLRKSDGLMVIGAPSGNEIALTSPLDGAALGTAPSNALDPLFVNNNLPVRTLRELADLAKRQPGKLNIGSSGVGTSLHMTGELLKQAAGIAKGSGVPNKEKVGSVTRAQLSEIAQKKIADLNARDIEHASRMIEGTARSMGLEISD